ncbi:alcohol dehydrogenase cytochrome c [Gluconobacter thailandicus F149-1 = NBRC 100600]|uniref:Cytochrome c subunit of aldehyde dehydrogenase n=1 Tax=Gluconobacter thailandicus NBRC 3257 TaxID=1381097 RepID=A0ABQ0J0S2_GLUTH|nr:cytochrome c [Gluconobacter thailandicus]KXV54099.1 alcohol dehydrogenase [Gluconobacter thailandicus]GAC88782.1 putative cytochrome c subunit of aldehyde dehydrogenase [Gluconobacter thailandicus NBRC 3255]GAD28061.1 putative cytochrome c subunit of aldehyde dehydrogenase [Gluconobacter thailandicus NBRC 3257]GAN94651.1 alcohol dehydrogenase cytochrome c [Gluconobacter thailandicus F149-1 = NBRC 100600]GBR61309.1 gluconate 2-dehydrogenase, cytochrome c subunit [Gluconobacter thailandicus F
MKYFLLFFAVIMAISARSAQAQTDLIEQGKTLFRAADCAACHLSSDGQTLSGGKAFSLPFGTVYAVNITPDRETGIGAYTDEQWLRMMRTGVDRNERHLYPVMPYTSYTFLNDADTLAIKAYLFTLKPVQAKAPENRLPFPFNQRWVMTFWNWFNNPNRRMTTDPHRTPEWNRGAYLVEALGHCDQCHTPRNFMFGLSGKAYAGTVQVGWRAYNLTSDTEHGLGGWSDSELFEYLSTGYAPHRGPASGPMAEAIKNSLRYLPAEDIRAMIVYLRSIPARSNGPQRGKRVPGASGENEDVGRHIFQQACMGCHLENGAGRQSDWGALEGAHSLSDPAATNIIAVLRTGTSIKTEHGKMAMPSFTKAYTPQELTAISEYLLDHFGGIQAPIKPESFKN